MKDSVKIILFFILLIWLVEIINIFLGHSLIEYGIYPRHIAGLTGILLHPFIHGSLSHLVSNTVPLFVLAFIISLEGAARFLKVTLFIVLTGGTLLWLLGRSSYHIGASLLIFGYFGYVILNAFYRKTPLLIIAAAVTVFLYGGILYGLFPVDSRVSWEGHLFGLIAGILAARSFKNQRYYSRQTTRNDS